MNLTSSPLVVFSNGRQDQAIRSKHIVPPGHPACFMNCNFHWGRNRIMCEVTIVIDGDLLVNRERDDVRKSLWYQSSSSHLQKRLESEQDTPRFILCPMLAPGSHLTILVPGGGSPSTGSSLTSTNSLFGHVCRPKHRNSMGQNIRRLAVVGTMHVTFGLMAASPVGRGSTSPGEVRRRDVPSWGAVWQSYFPRRPPRPTG